MFFMGYYTTRLELALLVIGQVYKVIVSYSPCNCFWSMRVI